MNTLSDAYIQGQPAIRAQFPIPPEALFQQTTKDRIWAPGMAVALEEYQAVIGALKSPLSGKEGVIITGQQPGLFGGPLYTVFKAITAVKLAEKFNRLGKPCIPIFWVAGDDHDFIEVSTAHFLTRQYETLSLTYTPDFPDKGDGSVPMYRMPLSDRVHSLIDAAAESCFSSEMTVEVKDFLHDTLDKSHSVSHWFSLIMARLFEKTALRFFEPQISNARIGALPVLRREIEAPLQSTKLLIEEGVRIESLGFKAPIQRDEDVCNFFIEVEGQRRKVHFQKERYIVEQSDRTYSINEMLDLLAFAPERFSPNVALRPVVQQQLFMPVACIAGPGEIAYWAQLKPVFDFFSLPMPVVYPRIHGVITNIKINNLLKHYDLRVSDVIHKRNLLTQALQSEEEAPIKEASVAGRAEVENVVARMISNIRVASDLPSVRKATDLFQRKISHELDELNRALLYAHKEKRATIESRLTKLSNSLLPMGKPQERVFSVFTFLFQHGWPLMDRMIEAFDPTGKDLQEMEL